MYTFNKLYMTNKNIKLIAEAIRGQRYPKGTPGVLPVGANHACDNMAIFFLVHLAKQDKEFNRKKFIKLSGHEE